MTHTHTQTYRHNLYIFNEVGHAHNITERSCNNYCNGNTTMNFVCDVELHVTVINTKIFSVP